MKKKKEVPSNPPCHATVIRNNPRRNCRANRVCSQLHILYRQMKKSASEAGVYRSKVSWTPMNKSRREATLASLRNSQTIKFSLVDTSHNSDHDIETNFTYNKNKTPLNTSQTASIFTSSNRLSLESFQVSKAMYDMQQQIERAKAHQKRQQSKFLGKLSSSVSS